MGRTRMLGRRTVGASYFWLRDSRYVKEGRSKVSRYTHQTFTPLADNLSVTPAASRCDSRNAESEQRLLSSRGNMIPRCLERETGIEPATNGLGSRDSTTELLPLSS